MVSVYTAIDGCVCRPQTPASERPACADQRAVTCARPPILHHGSSGPATATFTPRPERSQLRRGNVAQSYRCRGREACRRRLAGATQKTGRWQSPGPDGLMRDRKPVLDADQSGPSRRGQCCLKPARLTHGARLFALGRDGRSSDNRTFAVICEDVQPLGVNNGMKLVGTIAPRLRSGTGIRPRSFTADGLEPGCSNRRKPMPY